MYRSLYLDYITFYLYKILKFQSLDFPLKNITFNISNLTRIVLKINLINMNLSFIMSSGTRLTIIIGFRGQCYLYNGFRGQCYFNNGFRGQS